MHSRLLYSQDFTALAPGTKVVVGRHELVFVDVDVMNDAILFEPCLEIGVLDGHTRLSLSERDRHPLRTWEPSPQVEPLTTTEQVIAILLIIAVVALIWYGLYLGTEISLETGR